MSLRQVLYQWHRTRPIEIHSPNAPLLLKSASHHLKPLKWQLPLQSYRISKRFNVSVASPRSKSWIHRLPLKWIPFAELARLDKPIGTWLLYWPCGKIACS